MGKTCPEVARGQLQTVYAVIEDVSGVLQPPEASGYIVPVGRATMIQTPTYTDSDELSPSLNQIDQFQDAVPAGTGSIAIYGRLNKDFSKPQGDALFIGLMGDYNDPTKMSASVADAVTATGTTITIENIVNDNDFDDNILDGKFPPIGTIQIGSEKIYYPLSKINADGSITLNKCHRGYDNTTAAAIDEGAEVQMLSRIYSQSVCRPTLSIWILNDDKLCVFMSGCGITQDQVRLQRESGQQFTFDFQGRQMGWAGVSMIETAPTNATIQLMEGGADAYTPGGFIRNKTKKDDNEGKGYRVIAVNDVLDTITLDKAPTGWQAGDMLHPWLPEGKVIGTALESRFANIEINGVAGKMSEGGLTIGTPITNLEEIGDEYVGEGVSTKRSLTLERNINFRAKDGKEFGKGYRGYELPVTVMAGKYPCMTLAHHMPRVKFNTPELNESDTVLTMQQNGTALGVNEGNGENALFIIQI